MLADERSTVDAHDFSTREGFADELACLDVIFGLSIHRHQHLVVHHQEVGIGGRQTRNLVKDGIGQRQFDEVVMIALGIGEQFEVLFHLHQRFEVLVLRIIATRVKDDAAGCKTSQRVDVSVGIVASEFAMIEP